MSATSNSNYLTIKKKDLTRLYIVTLAAGAALLYASYQEVMAWVYGC